MCEERQSFCTFCEYHLEVDVFSGDRSMVVAE